MDAIALVGRAAMSAIMLWGGYNKAMAPAATIAYFTKLGLFNPQAAYAVTLAVEIGVALLFLLGWKARWMALVLAVWCLATAWAAHLHFEDRNQVIHLMKNINMAGGFLQILAFGAGRFSLDRR